MRGRAETVFSIRVAVMKYQRKLIVISLLISGCAQESLSNPEIIAESKLCEAAGMDVQVYRDGWTMKPVRVECKPIKASDK